MLGALLGLGCSSSARPSADVINGSPAPASTTTNSGAAAGANGTTDRNAAAGSARGADAGPRSTSAGSGASADGGADRNGDASAGRAGSGLAGASEAGAGRSTEGAPGAATCAQRGAPAGGDETVSIPVGGMMRTFVQHVPPANATPMPMPVVIDFHGKGGSGARQANASGWGKLADEKGFIVIWPDGVGNTWNAGRCCGSTADDVAFVRAILAMIEARFCIDPKRVYATGCSAGGAMTYKLACDAADIIAAVAPVDFDCAYSADNTGATPSCGGCSPARPIPEMQFRGTADSMAVFEGGIRPGARTSTRAR